MIDILEQERRACEVRKERAEDEALRQAVTQKILIVQQRGKFAERCAEIGDAALHGQRLAVDDRRTGLHEADDDEQHEDAAPVGKQQHLPADDGREDRRETVHHHEDGEEARELDALGDVARNRARDDDAGGAGEAHEEAQREEHIDVADERAAGRRHGKDDHAREERRPPPVAVRKRPHDHLPGRHADHRHRQRQLRERRRDAEVRRELRQRRQIHIRRKRRHRTHHAEEEREEQAHAFCQHHK